MKKLIFIIALLIVGFSFSANAQVLKNSEGHVYDLTAINNGNLQFQVFETQADYDAYKVSPEGIDFDRTGVYLSREVIKEIKELITDIPEGSNLYVAERVAVLEYLVKYFKDELNFRNLQRNKFEKSDLVYAK